MSEDKDSNEEKPGVAGVTDDLRQVGIASFKLDEIEIPEQSYRVKDVRKALDSLMAINDDVEIKVTKVKLSNRRLGDEDTLLVIGTDAMLKNNFGYVIVPRD